jgi:hypothetical protein
MRIQDLLNPITEEVENIANLERQVAPAHERHTILQIERIIQDRHEGRNIRVAVEHFPEERRDQSIPPSTVVITPLRLVNEVFDLDTLVFLANRLRREVVRVIRRFYPHRTIQDIEQTRGNLVVFNDEGDARGYTVQLNVGEITYETFLETYQHIVASGSNPEFSIRDLNWKFWINHASLQRGGGNFTNPKNLKGLNYHGKKLAVVKEVETKDLGCGAIALALGWNKITREFNRPITTQGFTLTVANLQKQLNFKDPHRVTIEELSRVVEILPDFRLVVIEAHFVRPFIYEGQEYKRDSDQKNDKTIFIYYDAKSEHYEAITGFYALMSSLLNTNDVQVCYDCCGTIKRSVNKSHCFCEGEKKKSGTHKPQARVHCEICGEIYLKYVKHFCGESKCKICSQYYKRDLQKDHRCPLMIQSGKIMDQKFAYDEISQNEMPENPFELWAWDIESELVYVIPKLIRSGILTANLFNKRAISRMKMDST